MTATRHLASLRATLACVWMLGCGADVKVADDDDDGAGDDGGGGDDGDAGATGPAPEANVLPQRGGAVLLLGWRR